MYTVLLTVLVSASVGEVCRCPCHSQRGLPSSLPPPRGTSYRSATAKEFLRRGLPLPLPLPEPDDRRVSTTVSAGDVVQVSAPVFVSASAHAFASVAAREIAHSLLPLQRGLLYSSVPACAPATVSASAIASIVLPAHRLLPRLRGLWTVPWFFVLVCVIALPLAFVAHSASLRCACHHSTLFASSQRGLVGSCLNRPSPKPGRVRLFCCVDGCEQFTRTQQAPG
jgi:hypothetical protein